MRRWLVLLMIVLLVVYVGIAVFAAVALRQPSPHGPISRHVTPSVVWVGNPVSVTLAIDSEAHSQCRGLPRTHNVVLLLDRSESMRGKTIEQALTAARVFLSQLDFATHRVAVVFFNETPQVVQQPTTDTVELQRALASTDAGGQTFIDLALDSAQALLSDAQTVPQTGRVVILLSDGGAENPDLAMTAAQRLRNAGIRLFTVALPGDDLNEALMRDLASSPAYATRVSAPTDLVELYRGLAYQLNTESASDVLVDERTNNRFVVVANSLSPEGNVEEMGIRWELASMPQRGAMFRYQLVPRQFGLHEISPSPGETAMTDCNGGNVVLPLPSGPRVLALGWPLFLFLLPLLLAPLSFFAFWQRKQPPPVTPTPPPLPQPDEPEDAIPDWLKLLDAKSSFAEEFAIQNIESLQNTVIIGCGSAGREVLKQTIQAMHVRFGDTLPGNVRFLQIEAVATGKNPPALPDGLRPEQRVTLQVNLQEVDQNLQRTPQDWSHWDWYANAAPGFERARGRMAVFYDLRNGSANSVLWPALHRVISDLASPTIRLVGTTFDDLSGLLIDVAHLVHLVAGRSVDVEFWLMAPIRQDFGERLDNPSSKIRASAQQERSLATLREIERLQRNAQSPFIYVPSTSKQSSLRGTAGAVVQTLFVFESSTNATPESDTLACMADCLLALLHPSVNSALSQHLAANRVKAGDLVNTQSKGVVCSMGSYSYRFAVYALGHAMGMRLVRELLFDSVVGLVPLERCDREGKHHLLAGSQRDMGIDRNALREDAERFVNRFRRSGRGLSSAAFVGALRRQTSNWLNGEGKGKALLSRTNGLRKARTWLEEVRRAVLLEGQPDVASEINALRGELETWEIWLSSTIYPMCKTRFEAARTVLTGMQGQMARNWSIEPTLEWPFYRQRVRPWDAAPDDDSEPVLRAAARFGWRLEAPGTTDRWQLRLVVPPPSFVWQGEYVDATYAVAPGTAVDSLLNRMYTIAGAFCRLPVDGELLLASAGKLESKAWLERAAVRMNFNNSAAAQAMGQVNRARLLVGPRHPKLHELANRLAAEGSKVAVHETDDSTSLSLVDIQDWIPLSTCTYLYSEETWREHPVPSGIYVWRPEQLAAELETSQERLSARFVGWLSAAPDLVRAFARAYLYESVQSISKNEWTVPGIGTISAVSVGSLLANLVEEPPMALKTNHVQVLKALNQTVEAQRNQLTEGRLAYLREARKTRIDPLLQRSDYGDKDLGLYLVGILDQER